MPKEVAQRPKATHVGAPHRSSKEFTSASGRLCGLLMAGVCHGVALPQQLRKYCWEPAVPLPQPLT